MIDFNQVQERVKKLVSEGKSIEAADELIKIFELDHENFEGFELREAANPDFILMTTNGVLGQKQRVVIPENTFQFSLPLMLNLLAHEMLHVRQKSGQNHILDKNEREWQAYYEMLFHKLFPQIPELSNYYKKSFALKALKYYKRMGEGSKLQEKYAEKKKDVEVLLNSL